MANQLIPFSEFAAGFIEEFNKLSPAEMAAAAYDIQTSWGGFPRDLDQEKKISEALKAESIQQSLSQS